MITRRKAIAYGCGLSAPILFRADPFRCVNAAQSQLVGPFSIAELERARASYGPAVMAMFQNDLIRRLPPTMGSSLANAHLEMPLEMPIDEARSFVLAAGSSSDYRLVVLPIRTILFVQQYAAVLAYYGRNGCPIIQPLLYAKMLTSDKAIGLRPPGPLEAFGLTNDIYQDQFTKDVADKLTKSALFFILAHELGHLFYNHTPHLRGPASIAQEKQADAFALDAASAVGVFPMGFVMYFQVMSVSAQGESQDTHPLSSDRVEAVARKIADRPAAFMDPREDPARFTSRVLDAAETLRRTAHQLDQRDVHQNFEYLSKITSWENLATDLPLLLKIGACHT